MIITTLVAGSLLLLAACSTNSSAQAPATASAADQISVLAVIDGAGFHGIDKALAAPNAKIDASWLGKVQHAQVAAKSVAWPKELQSKADAFADAAGKLAAALSKDDAKGAAGPAHDTHEAQHALSNGAWDTLSKAAGVSSGSGGH